MDPSIYPTKTIFFQFLNEDLSVENFEKWVFQNKSQLATEVNPTLYLDLITFDYEQNDSLQKLYKKLTPFIEKKEYNVWRIKRLLSDIIENKIDLVLATRKLRSLYVDTEGKLIPITLGIGYESEIGDFPTPDEYNQWNEGAIKEKLEKIEAYRINIVNDAKRLLAELNKI